MNILTIDAGTTNTRVSVWRNEVFVGEAATQVGVRETAISGNRTKLQMAVRETIAAALAMAGIALEDVELILASGMITSNVGLCEIPHLPVNVGCAQLAAGMVEVQLLEVCSQPIWFIPGVRNVVADLSLNNFEAMDMMRGEEVETMGLISRLDIVGPAVIVLPGSHSKFVHVNAQREITGCVTTLAGELLQAITHNTILASSLDGEFAAELDREMLLAGARMAASLGLGRACFAVRTLDRFAICERNARANFLLGAVLGADLLTLKNSSAMRLSRDTQFVIGGKTLLRESLALLVSENDYFCGSVQVVNDEQQANLAGFGAITVAHQRGLLGA